MIKLFLVDVDGTLTDGFYHTSEEGTVSKSFFTRDFHGFWMLNEAGVQIGIIAAGSDDAIDNQLRRGANYADLIKGSKDKVRSIEDKYVKSGPKLRWDEIAYIADDVFDIGLLEAVEIAACPSDSAIEVLELIDEDDGFLCQLRGGRGCVREFADYVLEINRFLKSTE